MHIPRVIARRDAISIFFRRCRATTASWAPRDRKIGLIHLCQLTSSDYARSPRFCSQKSPRCLNSVARVAKPNAATGFAVANPPAAPKATYTFNVNASYRVKVYCAFRKCYTSMRPAWCDTALKSALKRAASRSSQRGFHQTLVKKTGERKTVLSILTRNRRRIQCDLNLATI